MFRISKKWVALVAVSAVAVVAAVGVYAYWTQGGTGSGSAGTGTTTGITVNQTSAPGNTLYPGGPSQALSGDFDNPSSGPVVISSVTAVVSSVTGGAGDLSLPACTPADFSIGGSQPAARFHPAPALARGAD